jgi:hypothetical protein
MRTLLAILVVLFIGSLAFDALQRNQHPDSDASLSFDQHEAISFGIAAANYRPSAAEELIRYKAKQKYPTNTSFQSEFVTAAMAGYRAEQKFR